MKQWISLSANQLPAEVLAMTFRQRTEIYPRVILTGFRTWIFNAVYIPLFLDHAASAGLSVVMCWTILSPCLGVSITQTLTAINLPLSLLERWQFEPTASQSHAALYWSILDGLQVLLTIILHIMYRNNIHVQMGTSTTIPVCCTVLSVVSKKKVNVFYSIPVSKEHEFYQYRHGSLINPSAYIGNCET
jgi:hypothetical protein